MYQRQSGFTLIEIAIVLVIIGLLLGGVLKGQELIENAKIKSVRNDISGIETALHAYQDRYHALPGDDLTANAALRGWTDSVLGNGNGALGAAGDAFTSGANENQQLWQHLRYSGLISGNPAGTVANVGGRANPIHGYGGLIGIGATTAGWGLGLSGNIICAGDLPAKAAQALDFALDDGVANAGSVRSIAGATNTEPLGTVAAAAAAYLDNGTRYTLCKSI